jgi:hypothetical protein
MIQLCLFPPPAAPKQPLPDKVRKEARNLMAELLKAVIVADAKQQPCQEEAIDE